MNENQTPVQAPVTPADIRTADQFVHPLYLLALNVVLWITWATTVAS